MNKQELIDSLNRDISVYEGLILERKNDVFFSTDNTPDDFVDMALDIRLYDGILSAYRNCLRRVKRLEEKE